MQLLVTEVSVDYYMGKKSCKVVGRLVERFAHFELTEKGEECGDMWPTSEKV